MESLGQFHQFLKSLPALQFNTEREFVAQVLPRIAEYLGYSETETFYNYPTPTFQLDAVFAATIGAEPWVALEFRGRTPRAAANTKDLISEYLFKHGFKIGLMLTPDEVVLLHARSARRYFLGGLTKQESRHLFTLLARSSQSASIKSSSAPKNKFEALIKAVESAGDNDTKGKSLERLAHELMDDVAALRCKYKNLKTRSSEIDIVVEYDHTKSMIPLFQELGRYILVECKNWSKSVGVSSVRDFMAKLDKSQVRLGIIFSKNGVTGVDAGADALREIQSKFDRDGTHILVFSLEDVRQLKSGADFIQALDRKADILRFDISGA